jgi:hypothetical protein
MLGMPPVMAQLSVMRGLLMTDKIIDISQAREEKNHVRKEEKLTSLKERFERAMGMEKKPKPLPWGRRKKPKKPDPEGW